MSDELKTSVEESLEGLFIDPTTRPKIHSQQVHLTMAVTKPKKGTWFRVHPEHEREVFAVEDPTDSDKLYVVHPNVAHRVPPERPVPCTGVRRGRHLLRAVRLPHHHRPSA